MRHLRSINENKVHQDNIDLIVDIGDIFIFLEDDWGFDIKCTFTEINDNLTLGFRNIRKYNKNGTIYAEKNSDISRFGSGSIRESIWTLESRGSIEINNSILDLYRDVDGSIERCCNTLGFDSLSTRSNIEFGLGKIVVRFTTFFFGDTVNTGESEISRLENYIKNTIENESRKHQNANSPLEFGVRINLQFRK